MFTAFPFMRRVLAARAIQIRQWRTVHPLMLPALAASALQFFPAVAYADDAVANQNTASQTSQQTQTASHADSAASVSSAGQNTADPAETIALPTINVVAAPDSTPLVVVTHPKTPHQPSPASDGADYLKTIPGFEAIRSGGTGGDPVFRGMAGSRLNIMSNGIPMLGACPDRMDAPTSYLSPEDYDRVTVVKGPETVLYGPGTSAGTVNFERVTPRFDADGMRFQGSLTGGSFGRNDQNVDMTAGTPDVYTRITASHTHEQDYRDGNGQDVPSQWDKWNADATFGITPDADTRLEFTAGTGDGYARDASRAMDSVHFYREMFGMKFDKKHLSRVLEHVGAQVYYNVADHVMDNYTLRMPDPMSVMSMPMVSEVRRRTLGARMDATLRLSDAFKLEAGVDAQSNRLDSRSVMSMSMVDIPSYNSQPWDGQAAMWNAGLFGELTWYANDFSRVIGGARLDYDGARDERPTTGSVMGMGTTSPNPTFGETRSNILPSGFVRYEHDVNSLPAAWYAGLGHAERFPDYWELFSPTSGPNGSVNAFAGLQPEKTTQLDIGIQHKSRNFDAWASAYIGYVQNFILFNYSSDMMGQVSQATNVDAQIMGGELGVSWRPVDSLRFDSSLAYAWGRNVQTGQPLPQMPPLEARFGVDYSHGAWSVGGLWRVVAPQHRYALNQGNVVGMDFGPSGGFAVLSLHGQYNLTHAVQLSVGVDNLFNKAYAEHLNMAGNAGFGYAANAPVMDPGRTVWVRLNVKM